MRLLYVIDSLVPGGAETSLAAMASRLVAGGIELHVAYFHDRPGVQAQIEEAGATLHLLGPGSGRRDRVGRVRAIIRELHPDLVHTTIFEADLAGRIAARLEHVASSTTLSAELYGPTHVRTLPTVKVRAAQLADIATAQLARRFHATGHDVGTVMRRRLLLRRNRIDVVQRGRDATAMGRNSLERRAAARSALGLADEPLVLGAARQEPEKGFDVLLAAVAQMRPEFPRLRLIVAGRPGVHTPELERLLKHLQLEDAVTFLGHRDDLADLLCAADVFAFPTRREGLPGTLIEALALECPVVASDIPNVREVVADHATLVPMDDIAGFERGLSAVLRDPAAYRAKTAAGRRRFETQFTIDRAATEMIAFFERAADSGWKR